jgi:hypothetical protein
MEEMECKYRLFDEKPDRKRPLVTHGHKQEENVNVDLEGI